jgi:hypothetical protein
MRRAGVSTCGCPHLQGAETTRGRKTGAAERNGLKRGSRKATPARPLINGVKIRSNYAGCGATVTCERRSSWEATSQAAATTNPPITASNRKWFPVATMSKSMTGG